MEIGMATKEDSDNASQEGDQRIIDLALQAVYKRRVAKVKTGRVGHVARQDILQLGAEKEERRICTPWTKTTPKNTQTGQLRVKKICRHAAYWKRQEVISRQRAKKTNQASLLSVESSHDLSPKNIVEEKDRWVKVRVTMDSGAAGHVMPETMFPHAKIELKTPPINFVAANGEQIKDLGAKRIPFKTNEGVQRCIMFRSANVVKPLISMQKVVQSAHSKHWRWDGDQVGREQWCVHDGHVDLP